MKKLLKPFFIVFLCLSMMTGCVLFRNPLGSFNSAVSKQDKIEQKVQNNQDKLNNQARNYVYAADTALRLDPSTNRYTDVAQDFTGKALVVMGPPTMEEVVQLEKMVNNLLSTNKAIIIQGEKQLAAMNDKVTDLQEQKNSLQTKLDAAQSKIESIGKANSTLAQKWANLMRIIWGALYVTIGVFVIRIVTAVLPPPYNTISALIDVPIGLFTRFIHALIPGAKAVAGVVGSEYKTVSTQLVTAIQDLKDSHPELHNEISTTVANNVDSSLIPVVNQVKADAKIVS